MSLQHQSYQSFEFVLSLYLNHTVINTIIVNYHLFPVSNELLKRKKCKKLCKHNEQTRTPVNISNVNTKQTNALYICISRVSYNNINSDLFNGNNSVYVGVSSIQHNRSTVKNSEYNTYYYVCLQTFVYIAVCLQIDGGRGTVDIGVRSVDK